MTCQTTDLREIERAIAQLQSKGKQGNFHTNYFRQHLSGTKYYSWVGDDTIVFFTNDRGFHRVYYFTYRLEQLAPMLAGLQRETDLVLGYITKTRDERLLEIFRQAGYVHHAVLRKMRCDALPRAKTNAALRYATLAQVDELHARLPQDHDPYTGYLPTREELAGYVQQRWVIVNCANDPTGKVLGYIVFQILQKQVNCNFIFNRSDNALDWTALQRNFYGIMQDRGIHRGFLWVNSGNTEVIRMYQAQGWYFDGVVDEVFVRKGI
jgi:hypothetical protein